MSSIRIAGIGSVSPAGWGVDCLRDALKTPLRPQTIERPGWTSPMAVRPVPPPPAGRHGLNHPRLRRASSISRFAVGAAFEALGDGAAAGLGDASRLGVILCVMTGCVNYSRRFYDEVLRDPAVASPILFPETVFNAPASHLSTLLGTSTLSYTLVGDPGMFLGGLALAATWLDQRRVDGVLVVGAEELDWITADACGFFARRVGPAEGAGAIYLKHCPQSEPGSIELCAVTEPFSYLSKTGRDSAARGVRAQLQKVMSDQDLLCDSCQGLPRQDRAEIMAWRDWSGPRISPKQILGEGLAAGSAWQCVAAIDALQRDRLAGAAVSVVGCNQQAIGARFARTSAWMNG